MHYGKGARVAAELPGSPQGPRWAEGRGDLAEGSIQPRQEAASGVRGLAGIVALDVLSEWGVAVAVAELPSGPAQQAPEKPKGAVRLPWRLAPLREMDSRHAGATQKT